VLQEITALVESEARPGMLCSRLYREAVKLAVTRGFGPGRVFFIGHGLALEIDELPVLAKRYQSPLEEGMILAVEPKMVFPDKGAIGLENDYLVTPHGLEKLSHFEEDVIHL
jgi:Xaa-Pro dipeptidase